MTLAQLDVKIDALPLYGKFCSMPDRELARYVRDERLGILCGSAEPTPEQVQIVHDQLFPGEAQGKLL